MRTYYFHNGLRKTNQLVVMKEFGVYFKRNAFFRKAYKANRNHWVRIDKEIQENEEWLKDLEPLNDEELESMYFLEDI